MPATQDGKCYSPPPAVVNNKSIPLCNNGIKKSSAAAGYNLMIRDSVLFLPSEGHMPGPG